MKNKLPFFQKLFLFIIVGSHITNISNIYAQKVGIGTAVFTPQNMLDVKGALVVGNTYAGTNIAPANGMLVQGRVGIGNTAPSEMLDVTGNVRFSGALMPNNLAGTSGYILKSLGAGVAPAWSVKMTGVNAIERWYYPPFNVNAWTVYTVTATGVTGCTSASDVFICLYGDWTVQPDVTIDHIEAQTGQIKFRLTNNSLTTTYLGMDFSIGLMR